MLRWCHCITIPWSYQLAGWVGVLAHISTISVGTIVLDFKLSSTASNNVRRITEEYKVSKFAIYSLMAMNLYMANITTIWLLLYFDAINIATPSMLNIYEVLRVVGSVALYLLATEITFTAGHAWLHHTKWGREIHTIHHLCKPASLSSNLLFHPIDMAVEFGGPFLSLILMHVYIFQDPFIFKMAMTILNWYSADHDENLGLSHLHHHKEMGPTILTIYGRYEWFERLVATKKEKVQ